MVAADARTAIIFALSPGNDHDASHGRALLEELGPMPDGLPLLMDRAYEGDETRQLALDLGMIPVIPPKSNRLHPWEYDRGEYDRALYKKRNEKSNACSADLRVSAASFPVLKNWTSSSWRFSALP